MILIKKILFNSSGFQKKNASFRFIYESTSSDNIHFNAIFKIKFFISLLYTYVRNMAMHDIICHLREIRPPSTLL